MRDLTESGRESTLGLTPRSETRNAAYRAIDTERVYQTSRDSHNIAEWLTYMRNYADEGLKEATTDAQGLEFVVKVAALGVVCMEQHGVPYRTTSVGVQPANSGEGQQGSSGGSGSGGVLAGREGQSDSPGAPCKVTR